MKILIAEDDAVSRRILSATLTKWGHEVVSVNDGNEAWSKLQAPDSPGLAILDWMMPGMSGVDICRKVRAQLTAHPYLILLTALNRKENLVIGLDAGADDYLSKPFDQQELRVRLQAGTRIIELQQSLATRVRELEAAITERETVEEQLRNLSLTDDLTGLYNRRGFLTLARHHAKTTRRTGNNLLLIYCDMDGLKHINDTYGHAEGSNAIRQVADILRYTFRDSDVIGRLGGDEFAILGAVTEDGAGLLTLRLQENLRYYNQHSGRAYKLALSVGTTCVNVNDDVDIEELIERADEIMYREKRRKKTGPLAEPAQITDPPVSVVHR
ncbi:MAG TPA: diguanylate cyclase [Pyrinomonadaceae bacterium]|jgi:diguanylate cyclase (GGDEF)-like protein